MFLDSLFSACRVCGQTPCNCTHITEGLQGSLSKSDYTPGQTVKHTSSNCTTCHGRKNMYKTADGKLHADNRKGATKVKCPSCKGTGDKQKVAEGKEDEISQLIQLASKHEKTGEWEWSQGNYEGSKRHYAKASELRQRAKELKSQNVAEGEVVPFRRPRAQALTWQQLPPDVLRLAADWFWAEMDDISLDAVKDPSGFGSGTANAIKFITAKLKQLGWSIDDDDDNIILKNKNGQSVLLPIDDAYEFTGWAEGTEDLSEGDYEHSERFPASGKPDTAFQSYKKAEQNRDAFKQASDRRANPPGMDRTPPGLKEEDKQNKTSVRIDRMLRQLRAQNPEAEDDLSALLLSFEKAQRQDREDIGRLDQENDQEEADIDFLEKEVDDIENHLPINEGLWKRAVVVAEGKFNSKNPVMLEWADKWYRAHGGQWK